MDNPSPARLATLPGIRRLVFGAPTHPGGVPLLTDLSEVSKLPQLEELDVWDNRLRDLTSLGSPVHLGKLGLHNSRELESLSGLSRLSGLTDLDLNAGTADIAPVGELEHLERLTLMGSELDLSPLARLSALRTLDLYLGGHTDLAPLGSLIGLQNLALRGSNASSYGALAALTGIEVLDLGSRVPTLSFVSGMKKLRRIDVRNSPDLRDISPLGGHAALVSLELEDTGVEDLTPLASCSLLDRLGLAYTHVKTLAPLAGLGALRGINLAGVPGLDLMPLAGLRNLMTVTLLPGQVAEAALARFRAAAPRGTLSFDSRR